MGDEMASSSSFALVLHVLVLVAGSAGEDACHSPGTLRVAVALTEEDLRRGTHLAYQVGR